MNVIVADGAGKVAAKARLTAGERSRCEIAPTAGAAAIGTHCGPRAGLSIQSVIEDRNTPVSDRPGTPLKHSWSVRRLHGPARRGAGTGFNPKSGDRQGGDPDSGEARGAIGILLADDHQIVRVGVRRLLEERAGWEVCAEAGNGKEAVALAKEFQPQVAILDLSMPEMDGVEAAREIRLVSPDTRLLIFTQRVTGQLIQEVLAVGVRGYLLKSDAARYLVTAVEALLNGHPYFAGQVAESILQVLTSPTSGIREKLGWRSLTERELEVLRLVALGSTSKDIAGILSINVKTVESHRSTVARKLGLRSTVEMVHYAVRHRLIQL